MRINHVLFCIQVLAALQISIPAAEATPSSGATLQVRANIRPWLKFSATQPSGIYQVTAEDIRRGHIDLPRAVTISMQTNSPEEVRFDVSSKGPESIMVQDGGRLGKVVRMEGEHPSVQVTKELDMRIILPPNVREGTYPLHVALAPTSI